MARVRILLRFVFLLVFLFVPASWVGIGLRKACSESEGCSSQKDTRSSFLDKDTEQQNLSSSSLTSNMFRGLRAPSPAAPSAPPPSSSFFLSRNYTILVYDKHGAPGADLFSIVYDPEFKYYGKVGNRKRVTAFVASHSLGVSRVFSCSELRALSFCFSIMHFSNSPLS